MRTVGRALVGRLRSFLGLLTLGPSLVLGCIGAPPLPASEADAIALTAADFAGETVELARLPRRPHLRLHHPDGFTEAAPVFLFEGAADEALVADLERSPLSSEHLARSLPCDLEPLGEDLIATPKAALEGGRAYTLAVAGWAKSARGTALGDGGALLFELATEAGPAAGARVMAAFPADGASAVGTNLEAAVLAFDGEVHGAADGVWLEGPDGLAVPAVIEPGPCARLAPAYPQPTCVRIVPMQRLAPGAPHALVIGSAVRDGHGAAVGPFRAGFRTATAADTQPPFPLIVSCAVDETPLAFGCALVDDRSIALRVLASEAVTARLDVSEVGLHTAAPDGRLALRVGSLEADAELKLSLTLRDGAGNTADLAAALHTEPELATLSIAELYPDPLGPEPQQEFVELVNYGVRSVELLGFALSDRVDEVGEAIARPLLLPPQARVLLVPDDFDPREGRDPAPPPGALLLPIGKSLGSGGLRNAGEVLFLRDPMGRRVSAAPDAPRPHPGICLVRVAEDPRTGERGSFDLQPGGGCTPGR